MRTNGNGYYGLTRRRKRDGRHKGHQEEIARRFLQYYSPNPDYEVAFIKRVGGTLAFNGLGIQSLREELTRHRTCITCLSMKPPTNRLKEATERGIVRKRTIAGDRVGMPRSAWTGIDSQRDHGRQGQRAAELSGSWAGSVEVKHYCLTN
jgi:hypothetical protein